MTEGVVYDRSMEYMESLGERVTYRSPGLSDLRIHEPTGLSYYELRRRVYLARKNGMSISDVAEKYKVSKGFISKWTNIGKTADGMDAYFRLSFLSLPTAHKNNTPVQDRISRDVVAIRTKYPWMGSAKIKEIGEIKASTGTIDKVLRKNRLMGPPRKRKKKTFLRFERSQSMSLLQLDFKQWPDGLWSIWVIDDHSRMILGMEMANFPSSKVVIELMKGIVKRFGWPREILTDNGHHFRSFGIWCKENGIRHRTGQTGHPETQGKIERSHRTAIEETAHIVDIEGMEGRREALMEWVETYNTVRPHHSLDMEIPLYVFLRDLRDLDSFLDPRSRSDRMFPSPNV